MTVAGSFAFLLSFVLASFHHTIIACIAGTFDAQKHIEPAVERFAQLADTTPAEINANVGRLMVDEFRGCAFSYEKPSLKSEKIEQYSYVETIACPEKGNSKVRRRFLTRVRIPVGSNEEVKQAKLRFYLPVHVSPPKR